MYFLPSPEISRASNTIIPTTPEPPPASCTEPTFPSSSGSPLNTRSDSPPRQTPERNREGTPNRTSSRDSSTQNTPTQQQNQNQQNARNTPPASSVRERRPAPRPNDEQNGNPNGNTRVERGPNTNQPRRPNRTNRNRNSGLNNGERRSDIQPPDLPRGYG